MIQMILKAMISAKPMINRIGFQTFAIKTIKLEMILPKVEIPFLTVSPTLFPPVLFFLNPGPSPRLDRKDDRTGDQSLLQLFLQYLIR